MYKKQDLLILLNHAEYKLKRAFIPYNDMDLIKELANEMSLFESSKKSLPGIVEDSKLNDRMLDDLIRLRLVHNFHENLQARSYVPTDRFDLLTIFTLNTQELIFLEKNTSFNSQYNHVVELC